MSEGKKDALRVPCYKIFSEIIDVLRENHVFYRVNGKCLLPAVFYMLSLDSISTDLFEKNSKVKKSY